MEGIAFNDLPIFTYENDAPNKFKLVTYLKFGIRKKIKVTHRDKVQLALDPVDSKQKEKAFIQPYVIPNFSRTIFRPLMNKMVPE